MFDDHELFLKGVRVFFTVSVLDWKWRKNSQNKGVFWDGAIKHENSVKYSVEHLKKRLFLFFRFQLFVFLQDFFTIIAGKDVVLHELFQTVWQILRIFQLFLYSAKSLDIR